MTLGYITYTIVSEKMPSSTISHQSSYKIVGDGSSVPNKIGDLMNFKRVTLFAGHYGSGKTNIAVNYAVKIKEAGLDVCLADLDIVNPYYRAKDSEDELEKRGIHLISSAYANSNVDLPAIPQQMYSIVHNTDTYAVMDIGGDDRGAYALGRYVPAIKAENDYRMVFVANCCRPLTRTPEDALEVMREIEAACGLAFTDIVNNSNLGTETTPETVLESQEFIQKLCRLSGLPLWLTTAEETVAQNLELPDVFPLQLQEKYFDLPTQKPGNRPLWG